MKSRLSLGILLGIGIGIIISSTFFIATTDNNKNLKSNSEFIKNEAKKLGMIDPEDLFSVEDTKEPEIQKEENKRIIIDIPKGSSSEEIAIILKQNGLINSEEEFLDIVTTNEGANKLKWGSYEFTPKDNIEDIFETIISGSQ